MLKPRHVVDHRFMQVHARLMPVDDPEAAYSEYIRVTHRLYNRRPIYHLSISSESRKYVCPTTSPVFLDDTTRASVTCDSDTDGIWENKDVLSHQRPSTDKKKITKRYIISKIDLKLEEEPTV
jgi:hypothetical protein